MALEDIEKLKEKVEKDPNSKLFVPLADEYRKMGMLDEAITVLIMGLENQPGYMSARVSLGKVYLEKQMMPEAKEEFEKVTTAIPDNLFAHKKLAEIYRDLGERDKAIGEYKTILKLNALDEDAISNLEMIQNMPPKVEEVTAAPEPPPVKMSVERTVHAEPAPEVEEDAELLPAEEVPSPVSEEEFEEFRKSIAGRDKEAAGLAEEETVEEIGEEEVISEEDMEHVEKEALTYVDMFKEPEAPSAPSVKAVPKEAEPAAKMPPEKEEKPVPNLKDAELFISQGNYSKAMKVYRDMLSIDPQDKYVLQKVEELKMLLKMLGKEHDAVIDKLEAFGEGIKKRKNEFLRNP